MSDPSATPSASGDTPVGKSAPKSRRPTTSTRSKKARGSGATAEEAPSGQIVEAPKRSKFPEFPPSPEPASASGSARVRDAKAPEPVATEGAEWPEPETLSAGTAGGSEGSGKRKRRRKKGKGGGGGQGSRAEFAQEPTSAESVEGEVTAVAEASPPRAAQAPSAPRSKVDGEQLAKYAWKIFLSEVGEEGIALINDQDAKELSRRCFRLAELFLEEQGRRR